MIYRHLDEIQNALSIVGGQKFDTNWDEGVPVYWSSTENSATNAWSLYLGAGALRLAIAARFAQFRHFLFNLRTFGAHLPKALAVADRPSMVEDHQLKWVGILPTHFLFPDF